MNANRVQYLHKRSPLTLPSISVPPVRPKKENLLLKVLLYTSNIPNQEPSAILRMRMRTFEDFETQVIAVLQQMKAVGNFTYEYLDDDQDWIRLDGSERSVEEMVRIYQKTHRRDEHDRRRKPHDEEDDTPMLVRVVRDTWLGRLPMSHVQKPKVTTLFVDFPPQDDEDISEAFTDE